MKTKFSKRCVHCHDVIETRHVFSKNNQVFLKSTDLLSNDWSPINFQWIPVLKMREQLDTP
ncbi:hypothetical protein [Euzebyella saccharophila]|uniref:Uncharacterized protein n=1 Tax=Euzebyella saccharophila TaxID=679664 RepID=A0ABV8JWA7_9FLAO|nr:hypothetical protein [Euzebyella saccharophila]